MHDIKLIVTFWKKIPYFPFFVPCVTIFFYNFLHLLLIHFDAKLKPVLIDCSVFTSLGSGFMHSPEHFFVAVVVIFACSLKRW